VQQDELLRRVVEVLEEQDVTYLLVGSLASGVYGEPRLTNEIDIGYIDQWARQLGFAETWQAVLDQVRRKP